MAVKLDKIQETRRKFKWKQRLNMSVYDFMETRLSKEKIYKNRFQIFRESIKEADDMLKVITKIILPPGVGDFFYLITKMGNHTLGNLIRPLNVYEHSFYSEEKGGYILR